MSPVVVKVGGSHAHADAGLLTDLVKSLAAGAGHAIIVTGGGPYADLVREEQRRLGLDDVVAHRMALLAMASFGLALAGLSPAFSPAATSTAIRAALADGKAPVWLPLDILDGRPGIEESWRMTSDSLAVWLAASLGAARIVFLKRASPPPNATAAALAEAGILDPLVPSLLARAGTEAFVCGPEHLAGLGRAVRGGAPPGERIRVGDA